VPQGRGANIKQLGDERGAQGALKKKTRRAPTWLVGSSEAKKVPGLVKKSEIFCRVFELPSPRNAQKRDKQNREKTGFFLSIVLKNFSKRFFWKTFFVVFLNSHR
jgi:hypothetical protein